MWASRRGQLPVHHDLNQRALESAMIRCPDASDNLGRVTRRPAVGETAVIDRLDMTAAGPVRVLTAKVNPGVEARCQPGLPPVG